jgi:asparagine synthase (glutamine-hydrolysing)
MCGFSGITFANALARDGYQPGLEGFRRSAARVAHRGDTEHNELLLDLAWLSHFRLAFQDVSSGRQPMLSCDRRHVILFNGEVYNHLDLREAIQAKTQVSFKTHSDTETLIEGWKAFGDAFFGRLEGEYAFIIQSLDGNEVVAHRDRFGVKPLFLFCPGLDTATFSLSADAYRFDASLLEFSSEIKGLGSSRQWNRDGLLRQFVGLYEPMRTPFDNVIQVPPGGVLKARNREGRFTCELRCLGEPVRTGQESALDDVELQFRERFSASVQDRLLSDVELGVYLSGGVDSKVVAYELSRLLPADRPMKSFTIGFAQAGYDESAEALRFARHFGFKPHLINIDDEALNYSYPLAVQNSELIQPFTNGAAKWWLSLFTRQYVNGVLTGDGADELLCGYPSYRYANWWKFVTRARGEASTIRELMQLLERKPLGSLGRDNLYLSRFSAHTKNPWLSGSSAAGTGQDFVDSLHLLGMPHPLFGQIQAITRAILGEAAGDDWLRSQAASIKSWAYAGLESVKDDAENPRHSLLLWQNYFARAHLPTLILNWVGDRMEMANTLEGRTPFLSNRLRRFVATLPDRLMVSGLRDKVLLRRAYASQLTSGFAATPKKQFNAPFLDSARLVEAFDSDSILIDAGINAELPISQLKQRAESLGSTDAYMATHLNSAYQTALAMSVVKRTIVDDQVLERDSSMERRYLGKGGPV